MSKVIYGLLAIIGVIAVAAIAIAIAGVATSSSNQQQITSVQRSLSVGGATGGTVVSSGSYSIYITYVVPPSPTQQTATAVVGTYTYTALSDSTGAVSFMRLTLSPMSYTFTAVPTASVVQTFFGNFSPTPAFSGFSGLAFCKPYSVVTSTAGTQGPYNLIGIQVGAVPGQATVLFYTGASGTTITSGYTIGVTQSIEIIVGTKPN